MALKIYTPIQPAQKRWAVKLHVNNPILGDDDLDLDAVDAETGERICTLGFISPSRGFRNVANARDMLKKGGYDPLDGVDEDFWSKSLHGAIAIGSA